MKYGTSNIIGFNENPSVTVTFENGLESPNIRINGLQVDGGGSRFGGYVCVLEAVANLFIAECERAKNGPVAFQHRVDFRETPTN